MLKGAFVLAYSGMECPYMFTDPKIRFNPFTLVGDFKFFITSALGLSGVIQPLEAY